MADGEFLKEWKFRNHWGILKHDIIKAGKSVEIDGVKLRVVLNTNVPIVKIRRRSHVK